MRKSRAIWKRKNAISMNKYRKSVFSTPSRKNKRLLRRCPMLRSEYDRERSQVRVADDFGQTVSLSSEQAFMLFRWLSQLFSQCQGCDQLVSLESVQVLTYLREVAPFQVQTVWLCPNCYADMSVHTSK